MSSQAGRFRADGGGMASTKPLKPRKDRTSRMKPPQKLQSPTRFSQHPGISHPCILQLLLCPEQSGSASLDHTLKDNTDVYYSAVPSQVPDAHAGIDVDESVRRSKASLADRGCAVEPFQKLQEAVRNDWNSSNRGHRVLPYL